MTTQAGVLLAQRVMRRELEYRRRRVWVWPTGSDLEQRLQWTILGVQVVREWCEDRCTECGGNGRVHLLTGKAVAGIGRAAVPGVRFTSCGGCNGSGFARTSAARRSKMLGITMAAYERVWQRRFALASVELTRVAACIDGPLHSALKRA